MNILLTSVGRRSYLIKYFKDALGTSGEVHVTNSTAITPAFCCADKSIVTPMIYDKNYIPFLIDYCKENKLDAIIPLFDIDLLMLSTNKQSFEKIGTRVIVSDESVINICNDKLNTYNFLVSKGFRTPKTFITLKAALDAIEIKELSFPVILKPRWGMGSIGVFEADNENELIVLFEKVITSIKNSYLKYASTEIIEESVLIQEKLSGCEYGLDIINDLNGKYQNTIVKKKYSMRSGETDCAETVHSPLLKNIGAKISKELNHIANLDVDVFLDGNTPYILELNARFGGGYPFSHIAGVNLPLAIIKWLREEEVEDSLLTERIGMLAHKDINIVEIKIPETIVTGINNENCKYIQLKSEQDIINVLHTFNDVFDPSISQRVSTIDNYAKKLTDNGIVYIAINKDKDVIGFISFYSNDKITKTAYITFLAVHPSTQNKGVGRTLLELCMNISKENEMTSIKLKVHKQNDKALRLYKNNGFEFCEEASNESMYMIREL